MKYPISVIGDCVQDMFILSRSKIMPGKDDAGNRVNFLSYIYGDKLNVNELHYDLGGSACNVAVAMRVLGTRTTIASMLGEDIYSRSVLEQLKKKKVGSSFLYQEPGKDLGLSFILLGPDRDRTILTYRAANDFSKIHTQRLFRSSRSYFIAGINKYSKVLLPSVLTNANAHGKKIYINPSAYQIDHDLPMLKKILRCAEVAVMNVEEARKIFLLGDRADIKTLLKRFKDLGIGLIVITDSKRGSYAYDGKNFYKAGIYSVKTIDTTGAGDSFAATFVTAIIKGYNIEKSLEFAASNAASVVSDFGAQRGLVGWRTLRRMLKKKKVAVYKI